MRFQVGEVKKVQDFKYLGSTVQSNGGCGKSTSKDKIECEQDTKREEDGNRWRQIVCCGDRCREHQKREEYFYTHIHLFRKDFDFV